VKLARSVSSGARVWKSPTIVVVQREEESSAFAQPSLQATKITELERQPALLQQGHFKSKLSAASANILR